MKTKLKRILAFVFCILLLVSIAGCAENNNTQDLPDLIIGSSLFAPYFYVDEAGQYDGIDVRIATEACRRMGYDAVFQNITWIGKDDYLTDHLVDCLWACFSMNGREKLYQWAGPYAYDRQVVAVLSGSDICDLSDLDGKTVAVQMDSRPEHLFLDYQNYPNIPVVKTVFSLYDMNEIVSALRREYVDACSGHEAALRHALDESGISYRILEQPLMIAETGVAFARDDTRGICQQLHTVLEQMRQDGTIAQILLSYSIEDMEVAK